MAHIKPRDLKGGGRAYQVRWNDASGRERSKQFDRRKDANAFRVEIERELLRGTYIDPKAGDTTFRRYAEQWRKDRLDHRPRTARRVKGDLERAYPHIGDLRMGAARRPDLQRLVNALKADGLAAKSIHTIIGTVASVWATAVEDKLIAADPCRKLSLPPLDAGEVLIPTTEQLTQILSGFHSRWYRRLVAAGAGTGLRSGEIRGLTEDRVDWLRRSVKVNRQLVGIEDGRPIFGPPKTDASYRTIPVAQSVIDVLAEQLADRGSGPEGLIFTDRKREPMSTGSMHHAIQRVLDPLGWPTGTGLHLFRHYFASLLIHHGLSAKVIQKRLGHATMKETFDTYGHLWPGSDEDSRAAVEEVLAPIIAGTRSGQRSRRTPSVASR